MAYGGRFIDWLRSLTAKSTTIDGTEQIHIDSSGLSQKATLANVIRYGGGSPRNATAGNATVTQTTDGALYLEVAGQTAGNARGVGAFDWQSVRNAATQVASGVNTVALGVQNEASGIGSIAIGATNKSQGTNSISIGTGTTASSYGSIAIGEGVQSSSGYTIALGAYTQAANRGQVSFGESPSSGTKGQAQGACQTFYTQTIDATLTPLNIGNSSSQRMVIPATRSVAFTGIVQAMCNVSSSSNFIKAWEIKGVITRDGNNTTRIVGTPIIIELAKNADGIPTPSTWAIASITADDTNEALAINVTGQAGTTIRWQATLMYSQVGF